MPLAPDLQGRSRRRLRRCLLKNTEQLTVLLAQTVMGWTVAPGRFLAADRRWTPQWRFQPERNLTDAHRLLDEAKPDRYAMGSESAGEFWARVEIATVVGEAREKSKPRALTFAIARALGINVESVL